MSGVYVGLIRLITDCLEIKKKIFVLKHRAAEAKNSSEIIYSNWNVDFNFISSLIITFFEDYKPNDI